MRFKITACCLTLLLLLNTCAYAATIDEEIQQLKQEYISIYEQLDPAIAAQMDLFIDDVINYAVANYDASHDLNIDIENAVAGILLTGNKYKEDLMPFLLEQDKDDYREQLIKMRDIVKKAVLARVDANPIPIDRGASGNTDSKETQPVVTDKFHFVDINRHWAQTKIETLVNLGLVRGISDTEFAPQRNITRAEFAAILARTLDLQAGLQYQGKFFDVPAAQWYFSVVNTAAKAGIINGYDKNHFGPNDPVTREQMALMVNNALAYKGKKMELTNDQTAQYLAIFSDNHAISNWARTSVAATVQAQIITGHSDGRFAPRDNATRAEAAAVILQMYNQI